MFVLLLGLQLAEKLPVQSSVPKPLRDMYFTHGHTYPDPQRDLRNRSPRTILDFFKDYIGAIMGLYRGSNFWILPGVWVYYNKIPIYPIFYLLKGDYT